MDDMMSKKLNKQAVWFVAFHTLFLLNVVVDVFEFL
jgi:hypothetical protein